MKQKLTKVIALILAATMLLGIVVVVAQVWAGASPAEENVNFLFIVRRFYENVQIVA